MEIRKWIVLLALGLCTTVQGQESIETCDNGEPTTARGLPDADEDSIPDAIDNCLRASNQNQRDTDGDGIGNACDPDFNNDCVVNFLDLGQIKSVFFSGDADADLNGDNVVNFLDLALVKQTFFQAPGPAAEPNICSMP